MPLETVRTVGVTATIIALLLGPADPQAGPVEADSAAAASVETVEGLPMMLPDGRLAIFGADGKAVVVLRVASFGAPQNAQVNLQEGDTIARFQGTDDPDLVRFKSLLAGEAMGATLNLRVLRGEEVHDLSFPKPGAGFRIPEGAPAAGSWTGDGDSLDPESSVQVEASVNPEDTVRGLLAAAASAGGPGMTLAVYHQGQVILSAAQGLASVEGGVPLSSRSVLPVASVTKQFTAFAMAMLADRGKLSLDDDIRLSLPEIAHLPHKVTIRHLLTHTSGLRDYTGLLALTGWKFGDLLTTQELLTLVARQHELQFQPGTQHRYSNTNYALLPIIVERITGVSFQAWMQQEVFTPLGMKATLFPSSPGQIIPGSALLYRPVDDGFLRDHGGPGLAGAGGLMSTSLDLLLWAGELVSPRVGGPGVAAMMQTRTNLEDGTEVGYGLGIGLTEYRGIPRIAHSGSGPGSASVLHVYPEDDLAIAVLANFGGAEVYKVAEEIADLYLHERLGAASSDRGGYPPGAFMITDKHFAGEGADPGVPLAPEVATACAGRYLLEEDEQELILEADGTTLLLKLAHHIPGVPLVHLGDGRFLFPPARWELSFDLDSRPAQHLVVHLSEDSIKRGAARDVRGNRSEARTLTGQDQLAYVGTYLSDELGVAYRILQEAGDLYLEHPRLGKLKLSHHSGDTFGLPGRQVARIWFHRARADDPVSPITGLTTEAYAWAADARFARLPPG